MRWEFIVAVFLVIFVAGCTRAGLANPAAVYCEEQGFTYTIVDAEGGQYGICSNGEIECDAWEFYRGECSLS